MIIELKIDPEEDAHRVARYLAGVVYGNDDVVWQDGCYRIGDHNDLNLWPHEPNWRLVVRYGRDDLLARVLARWGRVEVVSVDGRPMREADARASIPEPPPRSEGVDVSKALISLLESESSRNGAADAADLVRERAAFGRQKYGQPLMSRDGRSTVEDLRQEIGDALLYAAKAGIRNEDMSSLLPLVHILLWLMSDGQSPWRTGTPPESGRYLIVRRFPRPPRVDYWEAADNDWNETPAEDVLGWMPIPKWEGER